MWILGLKELTDKRVMWDSPGDHFHTVVPQKHLNRQTCDWPEIEVVN